VAIGCGWYAPHKSGPDDQEANGHFPGNRRTCRRSRRHCRSEITSRGFAPVGKRSRPWFANGAVVGRHQDVDGGALREDNSVHAAPSRLPVQQQGVTRGAESTGPDCDVSTPGGPSAGEQHFDFKLSPARNRRPCVSTQQSGIRMRSLACERGLATPPVGFSESGRDASTDDGESVERAGRPLNVPIAVCDRILRRMRGCRGTGTKETGQSAGRG